MSTATAQPFPGRRARHATHFEIEQFYFCGAEPLDDGRASD
ncbi:hypothetical protein [Nocardia sp. NPDC052112]